MGGGGLGLECDKLNPEVVKFQFDQWFGEAFRQVGPELAGKVLKRFHVDSWECGSQNWSPVFRDEFKKRRGYDLLPYLPVMAGIPVHSADFSERVLSDVRQTISELVVDIAVFTGEEIPRRAILPDRLVDILPGIFGQERVEQERVRLLNAGIPVRNVPRGVKTQANMADPENWVDPLRGYAYDSFNRDALLNLAKVENGQIVLPGGASYGMLVVPGKQKMAPDGGERMSIEVAQKLLELANQGATLLMMEKPKWTPGLQSDPDTDIKLEKVINKLFSGEKMNVTDAGGGQFIQGKKGKGRIIQGPYNAATFNELGILKDFQALDETGKPTGFVAWNHRADAQEDIYFVANQLEETRMLELSFRIENKTPELFDPVTGETRNCEQWKTENGRTNLTYRFNPNESLFVIFTDGKTKSQTGKNWIETVPELNLSEDWKVQFDPAFGGPYDPVTYTELSDWSKSIDDRIRFYSERPPTANYFSGEKSRRKVKFCG